MAAGNFSEEDCRGMEFDALMAIYENSLKLSFDDENTIRYHFKLEEIDADLILHLSDKYPVIPPNINVLRSSNHLVELETLLMKLSEDMVGEVMIYNLIEEAKNWATENEMSFINDSVVQNIEGSSSICRFFLEGKCRFAESCRNLHPSVSSKGAISKENDNVSTSPISSDQSCNNSESKDCVSDKKPSMKTASDVISRIQWDDKLEAFRFTIGYLDRFVGIIEKPFTDFSWEDISSTDFNVLSIPRHRIQYFKYCNLIVWDKRERLDNVFGSTGSGITIYDLINNQSINNDEEDDPQLDEELEILRASAGDVQLDEELEISRVSVGNKMHKKDNVPNYFLAFKVHDEEIVSNICELQKALVSREHGMNACLIQPQLLHVTMLMLTIKNDKELDLVKDILRGIQHALPSILPPSQKLIYRGVGSFKNRILYVSLENDERLQTWVKLITAKLRNAGICLDGNRDKFIPHLTVARLPANTTIPIETTKSAFSNLEIVYEETVFGKQGVSDVGLYSRLEPKDVDGFHAESYHVKNSLFAVFRSLKEKVLKYLDNSEGIECELKENARQLLTDESTVPHAADEALNMLSSRRHGQHKELQQGQSHQQQDQRRREQECKQVDKKEEKREDRSAQLQYSDRIVVIMRGIPGCGKTFLVENSLESVNRQGLVVCSPKQLFYRAGNSPIDQADTNIAEAYCRNGFLEALCSDSSRIVVVDDCHSQQWQYAVYKYLAAIFGVPVKVLEITCTDREGMLKCQQHSGETIDSLLKLVEEWQEDRCAVRIEPWFNNDSIKDTNISLKDLLN